MTGIERNKQNEVAFYDLMFDQCCPREAIEGYAGIMYIQHNAWRGRWQRTLHKHISRRRQGSTQASEWSSSA
jgi:hypothetical protein